MASVMPTVPTARADARTCAAQALFSNLSHEVRTPMNAILGLAAMIDRDAGDPEAVRRHAAQIEQQGRHLLALWDSLFDMSRLQAGVVQLESRPFLLERAVEAVRQEAQEAAEMAGLGFWTVLEGVQDLEVVGDEARLRMVLRSLLSNAVAFTPSGGEVGLTVTATPTVEGRVELRMEVSDSGVGMAPEFQKLLFQPFAREVASNVNPIPGMGLGLAAVDHVVRLMDGAIEVQSVTGEGSVFAVTVQMDAHLAASPREVPVQPASLLGLHFLAAEDNLLSAGILEELLDMQGATVVLVSDGQQAVDAFTASAPGTFDALILDLNMPVMDGWEATRAIRACGHPDAALVPILALTANSFDEDVRRSLEAGMDGHMAKPLEVGLVAPLVARARANRAHVA